MHAGAAAGFLAPAPWVKKFSARVSNTPPSLGCKKNSPMKAQKNAAKIQQSPHGKISAGGKSLIRLGAGQKREPHARPAAYTRRPRAQDAPQRTRSGGAGKLPPLRLCAPTGAQRAHGGADEGFQRRLPVILHGDTLPVPKFDTSAGAVARCGASDRRRCCRTYPPPRDTGRGTAHAERRGG